MRVLVTFAVDAEFAPWRKIGQFRPTKPGLGSFRSKIGDHEIVVLLTGIGCKRPWMDVKNLFWESGVDLCISAGLAGALRTEYQVGEMLVPEQVLISRSNQVVSCDPSLVELACQAGAKKVGRFYSADSIIVEAAEKLRLGVIADAVEMESGEVLQEAKGFGARAVAVRAISDIASEDLPIDFNKVSSPRGDVDLRKVAGQVLFSPGAIPSLVRFGRQSALAAEVLGQFLEKFVKQLSAHSLGAKTAPGGALQ